MPLLRVTSAIPDRSLEAASEEIYRHVSGEKTSLEQVS